MNIRQETAKMIRELRNAGHRDLSRQTYNRPVLSDNLQDIEMFLVRNGEYTVADFKAAINRLPDDAIIEIENYLDYLDHDGYSDGHMVSAYAVAKHDDVSYHSCIQLEWVYNLKKVRVNIDGREVFVDRDKLNSIL